MQLGKKSSSSNSIFQTGELQKSRADEWGESEKLSRSPRNKFLGTQKCRALFCNRL